MRVVASGLIRFDYSRQERESREVPSLQASYRSSLVNLDNPTWKQVLYFLDHNDPRTV